MAENKKDGEKLMEVVDTRYCERVPLHEVEIGECFEMDGRLFFKTDVMSARMYESVTLEDGKAFMFPGDTLVIPIPVTAYIQSTELCHNEKV